MGFLLQLPPPISFFIVSAVTTFFTLAGLYLVRRRYSADVLKENHEVAAIIFNAFGLFYGVMLAFVVFVTWSGYSDATKDLEMEANLADDLFHIAKTVSRSCEDNNAAGANWLRQFGLLMSSSECPKAR